MELGKGGGTFLKKSFPLPKPHPSLSKDFCRYRIPIAMAACGQKQSDGFRFRGPQRRETAAGVPPRTAPPAIRPVYKYL